MKYEVRLSGQAKSDLRSIYRYISIQLNEPQIAANIYQRFKTAINKLSELPERFPLYPHEPWHTRGLRYFPIGNYLLFYWIDNAASAVAVFRIMYSGRDIQGQLAETIPWQHHGNKKSDSPNHVDNEKNVNTLSEIP